MWVGDGQSTCIIWLYHRAGGSVEFQIAASLVIVSLQKYATWLTRLPDQFHYQPPSGLLYRVRVFI